MQQFVVNIETIKAEIIWVLKSVFCSFYKQSCDELSDIFAKLFPDSDIALHHVSNIC